MIDFESLRLGLHKVGSAKGLYVEKQRTGRLVYAYRYLSKQGTRHLLMLGDVKHMSLTDAEEKAIELKQEIKNGRNPVVENIGLKQQGNAASHFQELGSGFTGGVVESTKVIDIPVFRYEIDFLIKLLHKNSENQIGKQLLSRIKTL